jgi:hypothetical protein
MSLLLLLACGDPSPSPPPAPAEAERATEQRPQDNADEPATGRWNRARSSTDDDIAALEAIGYVGGEVAATGPGKVSIHTEASHPGYNFYVSGHAAEATLMDADGKVLHRWAKPFRAIWPDRKVSSRAHGPDFWRRAALLDDGGLLAIYEGHGLVRLDRDSEVLWAWDGLAHHDLEVLPDGTIWVLSRKARVIEALHPKRPVLEDFATHLSATGEVLEQVSVLEAVQKSAPEILDRVPRRFGDVFHTNSLEVLTGSLPHEGFEAGNLLVSMRATSTIAVLDPRTATITWWHHGDYSKQHDPTILPSGNLLLFDNLGPGQGTSAVKEYTLPDMQPVWSYVGTDEAPFFSRFCGASQRLANGNTLISESGVGHVLEVTPAGERVWAWDNPARAGDDGEFVAIVPELVRIDPATVGWLTEAGTP